MKTLLLFVIGSCLFASVACAAPPPTPTTVPPTPVPTIAPTIEPTATAGAVAALPSDVVLDRGNPQRTGVYAVSPLQKVPGIKWQTKVSATWLMPPLPAEGMVYAGGGDGVLYALDAETGSKIWAVRGFGQMETTGAIAGDKIIAGGYSKIVQALNRHTGDMLWTFPTESAVQAAPLVVDDTVYIATDRKLYAVGLEDGQERWALLTGAGDSYMSGAAFEAGVVYTTGERGLYAVEASSGKRLWHVPADMQYCGLAVADDKVFVGNFDKYFRAYDKQTGQELWKFQGGNVFWSSPAFQDGIVYTGNIDRNLYALDAATGKLIWSFRTDGDAISEPVLAGGVVYISDSSHEARRGARHLYALDAKTGETLWDFESVSTFLPAPAVGNGSIYLTSTGEVIALE